MINFPKNPEQKIGLVSLGCPRNLVDSEIILGIFKKRGYKIVDQMQEADIGIVNTCAFIEDAKKESLEVILDLIDFKKEGRLKKIIVAGCLAARYKKELSKSLKEVDEFWPTLDFKKYSLERLFLTPKHYAYLKISEGCSNNCSYCVIPKIKGQFRSFDTKSIIDQVCILDRKNISELNIIGQDISLYGQDLKNKINLTNLLKKITANTKNIPWIRLLYLNPERLDDELIEFIANNKHICKYLDLPLQHINNRILKLMRRKITKEQILKLLEKLRLRIPGIAIRTSLIVGFPGETDKEFNQLLDFVHDQKFERLGVFIYSREEGTPAYNFKNQISDKIKKERFDILMSKQQKISIWNNERLLNKEMTVLIDDIDENDKNLYLGRSYQDAPEVDGLVYIRSKRTLVPGQFVNVKIKETFEYDLVGEEIL